MKLEDLREILRNKEVTEEINRHLWIESQKAGCSIGIERATDEWLTLYAEGWLKYHMPAKHKKIYGKRDGADKKKTPAKKTPVKKASVKKTPVKKVAKKK